MIVIQEPARDSIYTSCRQPKEKIRAGERHPHKRLGIWRPVRHTLPLAGNANVKQHQCRCEKNEQRRIFCTYFQELNEILKCDDGR